MELLTESTAIAFAKENFTKLTIIEQQFNYYHSKGIISALIDLTSDDAVLMKLIPLAWIHDTGKIVAHDNHAILGVEVLKDHFELDEIDLDCIRNHGSTAKPATKEGKLFRCADGLSLFYPEFVHFYVDVSKKEGKSSAEIVAIFDSWYAKYAKAYADNPKAVEILNRNYALLKK